MLVGIRAGSPIDRERWCYLKMDEVEGERGPSTSPNRTFPTWSNTVQYNHGFEESMA